MEEARPTDLTDDEDDLIDIVMSGGPPWGFNISGGCEFGTRLFVGKVRFHFMLYFVGSSLLFVQCSVGIRMAL